MARPTHRVSITRKDGKEITFQNHKGETVTKKYCPIGALFPSKIEGGFSLSLERKVTLDPELVWVNVYPADPPANETEAPANTGAAARRRGAPRKPAAELFDDSDLPD